MKPRIFLAGLLLSSMPSALVAADVNLTDYDCAASSPSPLVQRHLGQIIQGQFYDYVEEISGDPPSLRCIRLLAPRAVALSKDEALDFLNRSRALTAPSERTSEQQRNSDYREIDPAELEKYKPIPMMKLDEPTSERPSSLMPPSDDDLASVGADTDFTSEPPKNTPPPRPSREVERQQSFVVPTSRDNRDRFPNSQTYPYNTIGFIQFTFFDSQGRETSDGNFRCSGTLVSPYVVLTAGHCVHSGDFTHNNGFADRIEFAPGQNQTSFGGTVTQPFGLKRGSRVVTTKRWTELSGPSSHLIRDYQYDIAAIYFDQPFTHTGTFLPIVYGEIGGANRFGYAGIVQGRSNYGLWHAIGGETSDSSYYHSIGLKEFSLVSSGGDSGGPFIAYFAATDSYELVGSLSYGNECVPECRGGGPWYSSYNQSLIEQWQSYVPSGVAQVQTSELTVSVAGVGQVVSSPAGINCAAICSASFLNTQQVALVASPSSGYNFMGWTGDCSGAASCTLAMNVAKRVTATFARPSVDLTDFLYHS